MKSLLKRIVAVSLLSFPVFSMAVEPLDINSATSAELDLVLTGVGQSKAEAIIAYRDQNGPFATIEDLTKVKGIGPALLEKNRMVIQVKAAGE
ncbi:ComE operon protein 1 [Marinomonas gallaica]|mgnify:CR=1 FL=1|uniref:ComE operon protein 1 n=1 Tax=Marinomonas gallaica TaxID=1806667 RepID=A0A1C3JSJ7_9GAMM|nr:helix-hairpin-helix domain-containing protein [Marinomonas gallaica]SBT18122.1 ComE operon protein 1 [Marinomonas gallaica]SBT22502.1 ComE operon protein 1 [Marinomonas gallaica]